MSSSTWYQVRRYVDDVSTIEVESATRHFVKIKDGSREAKVSEYHSYYPLKTQALQHLITRTENKIRAAQAELAKQEPVLARLQAEYEAETQS